MSLGKGCHSYLRGHSSDDRPWHVIADENDILQIGVSWSGLQWVRYESGWREEHKIESFSRPIDGANTQKREWISQIAISGDHLRFWDETMDRDDNIATLNVEYDASNVMLASGGVYSTGVSNHSDPANKPRSALLIVHNDGFVVQQEGLSLCQPVGKILLLHPHEVHALVEVNPSAERWAAVFLDYEEESSFKSIEESLSRIYRRIFNG